jgi:hypothetical protein
LWTITTQFGLCFKIDLGFEWYIDEDNNQKYSQNHDTEQKHISYPDVKHDFKHLINHDSDCSSRQSDDSGILLTIIAVALDNINFFVVSDPIPQRSRKTQHVTKYIQLEFLVFWFIDN